MAYAGQSVSSRRIGTLINNLLAQKGGEMDLTDNNQHEKYEAEVLLSL
jgi:hypothetical protein